MQYFLVHGEDSIKSNDRLAKFIKEARKRNWEVVYLDGGSQSIPENISFESLFSQERFFVHREFKKISTTDLDFIIKKTGNTSGNLILYANSEVPKTLINKLPKGTKVEEFKLPKLIWELMDSFYPGNAKNFSRLLHETIETQPIELIFEMLSRLLKDLYLAKKYPSSSAIPSWKLGKLKNQVSRFNAGVLEDIIADYAQADTKSKTTDSNLIDLLDLIVVERLA